MKKLTVLLLCILSLPLVSHAAPAPRDFAGLVGMIVNMIMLIIPLLFTLTLIVFIVGIVKAWILNGGDPTAVGEGKKMAVAGVVGFVVMVGVWGIISLVRYTFFGQF